MSSSRCCWRVEDWTTPEGAPGLQAIIDVPFALPSLSEAELEISETAVRLRGSAGDEVIVPAPPGSAFDAVNAAAKFSKKKQQLTILSPDAGVKANSSSRGGPAELTSNAPSPPCSQVQSVKAAGGYPGAAAANVVPAPTPTAPASTPTAPAFSAPQHVASRGPSIPDDDDDDDIPTLDSSAPLKAAETKSELDQLDGEDTDGVPVEEVANEAADEMMQKALAAREKKQQESEKSRKEALKSTSGLKKGFFGNDKKKEPKKKSSSDDQQIVKKSEVNPAEEEIPYITGSGADWKQSKLDSLKLPEVQAALKQQTEKMKTDQSWCTPQLMQALASRPDLMKGLSNPRVMEAFTLMQKDSKAAKKKYENDKEVTDFLMEFSKLMATHFEVLGKEEEKQSPPQATYQTPQGQNIDPRTAQIIQNPEVEKALKDPEVQQIIGEMQRGRPLEMRELAGQNPRLFHKLKILLDAGLFNLQGT